MELSQRRALGATPGRYGTQSQQPRKLMLALALLVIALVAVLVKDRQFWFGNEQATIESDMPEPSVAPQSLPSTPAQPAVAPKKQFAAAKAASVPKPAEAPVVTTNRTALPPLDVEVVAGDAHRAAHSAVPSITLETPTRAAERQPLAPAIQAPQATVNPAYPVLAQHMNVQGSVILQAIIGADGMVENLKVLSGPAILASAAQQAVREWRFKPIYQNGQAVESKAKITVNFTIKVNDSAANTTVADSRGSNDLTLTR
jgi:TonB family C-terminal domain